MIVGYKNFYCSYPKSIQEKAFGKVIIAYGTVERASTIKEHIEYISS
jgi:hypothetical protein